MARKKNKTETAPPGPAPVSDPPQPAAEAPAPPAPAPVEPLVEVPAAAPVSASVDLTPSPAEPVPAFLLEPGPELAPAPPPEPVQDKPPIDLVLANAPLAEPAAPVALLAPDPLLETLLDRIRKLEESLAQFQNLQAIEQRVAERVATQLQREKPAAEPAPSSALSTAAALLDAGKTLLPALALPAAIPVQASPAQKQAAVHRIWLLWDILAEMRAIIRMYVDPRYRLSWLGRTVPLALLGAFLTTQWWVPFGSLPLVGWVLIKGADVVIGFLLFKVLGHEARRYRETAPDLPPNLRL